ncbi:MAG: valine--tRNA ligase [Spirochaetia bacterium]|nr:valine--tRNA ligase [Spirochaetia bacterium]
MNKSESTKKELPKLYNPHGLENKWYPIWEKNKFFSWRVNLKKHGLTHNLSDNEIEKLKKENKYFSIVIPPPNVTGSLHLGHALNHTLQDIVTRFYRMKEKLTLWVPGTDHAGIATQNVVEKLLAKEGVKKWELGREKFEERVWQWKEESGNMITHQQRQLGESVDWEKERFTFDKGLSAIVKKVFVKLYSEKLIYQSERIINWCVRCVTALSNIEVEYKEQNGKLYYIKYPLSENNENYCIVATTRPETMLGDEALAVHPEDRKFLNLHNKKVKLPLTEREIPIITDSFVDKEFGTGIVKITPSHDLNDFEVSKRHNLPLRRVIDDNGKMNENAGSYKDLSREAARKKVLEDLEKLNLIEKVEDIKHAVGQCYRCQNTVEPVTSKQWFVDVKPLAQKGIEAVKNGSIQFIPKKWENTYFEWMYNIQDWCISRQLWWGHRIPAFYCKECSHAMVSEETPSSCEKCGCDNITQDEDVLDTWFSSALWPFSTLIPEEEALSAKDWPQKSTELKLFYPTSVLITGFDIIFFWVARMIMMGIHFMNDIPFQKVYIHGLIRDADRQKMSKSKGNVINPLEKMDEYGTDAFRFCLTSILPEGKDVIYDESRLKGYSAFCNKIWNTARYIWINQNANYVLPQKPPAGFSETDEWIIEKFNISLKKITEALENYRFSDYTQEIYNFIWNSFCDNYIELSKITIKNEDENKALTTVYTLNLIFINALKMLHPVMPFITEELFSFWNEKLDNNEDNLLITSTWPKPIELSDNKGFQLTEKLIHIIYKIRYLRAELGLPVSEKYDALITVDNEQIKSEIQAHETYIKTLSKLNSIKVEKTTEKKKGAKVITNFGSVYLDIAGKIDISLEIKRLSKEKEHLMKGLEAITKKLSNADFVKRAPAELVDIEKKKQEEMEKKLTELNELLAGIEAN